MTIEYEFLKWMCQDDARKIPFHLGNYKKIQGAFLLFPPFWAIWEITHVTSLCQPLFFPIILKEAYLLLTVARYLVNATLESSLVHRQSRDVQVQNHRYAWDPEHPHLAQPWRAGLACNQESLKAGYISSASLSIIFLTLRSRDPPDFFSHGEHQSSWLLGNTGWCLRPVLSSSAFLWGSPLLLVLVSVLWGDQEASCPSQVCALK